MSILTDHQDKVASGSAEKQASGAVNIPVGTYPESSNFDGDADAAAEKIVNTLNKAIASRDHTALANLFLENSYWRDHLVNTWDLRTIKGRADIQKKATVGPLDGVSDPKGVTFFVTFETAIAKGAGIVRLAAGPSANGDLKIFTLFLTAQELKNSPLASGTNRPKGVEHGGKPDRENWAERRQDEVDFKDDEPTVVIIGAGQAGLTTAARLNLLGVKTLIVDRNERVGDNWRKRYKQLVLHDPIWYDMMPFIPFPPNWPIFTPKDKIADFFEAYASILELNVWTSTTLTSSSWSDSSSKWTLELARTLPDGTTQTRTLSPHHLILATGHSGKPSMPSLPGLSSPTFRGSVLCHSSAFPGARPHSTGKRALVIGACNSAHDICQDYFENGYSVTMIQRSSTCVVSSHAITSIGLKGLYDETGPATADADLWLWGLPSELLKAQPVKLSCVIREHDTAVLSGLEKAGFRRDRGPDEAGLQIKYFQRGGGCYIDVGASQLIVDGHIKVKHLHGEDIAAVTAKGLLFDDGEELEADEIVLATGYENMRTQVEAVLGKEVAGRVGDVWGFDEEGEFRGLARGSGHPGFWFMGGNLAVCRYYSGLLALRVKGEVEGLIG